MPTPENHFQLPPSQPENNRSVIAYKAAGVVGAALLVTTVGLVVKAKSEYTAPDISAASVEDAAGGAPSELDLSTPITIPSPSPEVSDTIETPLAPPPSLDMAALFSKAGDQTDLVSFNLQSGTSAHEVSAPNLAATDLLAVDYAMAQNQLWIDTAVAAGELNRVEFVIDSTINEYHPDGYPEFIAADTAADMPTVDTIRYSLPSTGQIDPTVMSTMVRHEINHALVQNLGIGDRSKTAIMSGPEIAVDAARYSELCGTIRDIAVSETLPYATAQADALGSLASQVSPEAGAIFGEVAQSMRDGSFGKYQAEQGEANGQWEKVIQSCSVDDPWRATMRELTKAGIEISHDEFSLISAPIADIRDGWQDVLKNNSIYDVIREDNYFAPDTKTSDSAGHPYDNAGELMASLMNIVSTYPDELRGNISVLPADQQTVLRDLIKLTSDDMTRIHSDAPEFVEKIHESVEKVLSN